MKKIRILSMIFSILAALLFFSAPASATEDMMDNLLPDETNKKQEGTIELEYNKYPPSRYGMETQLEEDKMSDFMPWGWDDKLGKEANSWMATVNSTIWGFNRIFAALIGVIVGEAFNYDLIGSFSGEVAKSVQNFAGFGPGGFKSNGLWPYMITIVFVLVGAWGAYNFVIKKSSNRAMSGILSSIFILALSFGFFTNADKVLNGFNDVTSEIQTDILSFSMTAGPGSYQENEGLATVRNQIFNIMTKYPYMLLNFGTIDEEKIEAEWKKSGSRIDALLKTGIFTKERQEAVKYEVEELKNNNMKPQALSDRLIILSLVSVMNLVLGIVLLLLAGASLLYQVLVLVFTTYSPVALLIGLIPAFYKTAWNTFSKLAHAFYMKLALGFLMSLYFTLSQMVYKSTSPEKGYLILFLIQILVLGAVYFYRKDIIGIITVPFRSSGVNSNLGQSIGEYKQAYFKSKKIMKTAAKPLTAQAAPMVEKFNRIKYNPGIGVVNPMNHPNYAPRKDKQAKAANQSESKQKPFERKANHPDQKNSAEPVKPNQKPPVPEPVDRERDFDNLQETMNEGGWAHRKKEEVKIKPELKDRMKERREKIVPEQKEAVNDDGPLIKDWRDKRNENIQL